MTIIEAKKLAEQGKIVIAPNGQEFLPADFDTADTPWLDELVFGEWTEKRELTRLWVNVYEGYFVAYETLDRANSHSDINRIRCIELVEVMK